MMLADGTLRLYTLENTAEAGEMPVYKLVEKCDKDFFFADRVVGYNRQYAALGADQYISKLVRLWDVPVEAGEYAIIDDVQYRIDMVQRLKDEDGLKVVDLTLAKLEERYDCAADEIESSAGRISGSASCDLSL